MTGTRIDVGNLPDAVDVDALRACFERFGAVVDVRVVYGGHAFVTMATPDATRSAIATLDGATFDTRPLRVSTAREQPSAEAAPRRSRVSEQPRLRIVRQLVERCNVMYEIEHADTILVIRMFPTDDGAGEARWRVEARSARAGEHVLSASASTRIAALDEVARAWRDHTDAHNLPMLDWRAIVQLLNGARAF